MTRSAAAIGVARVLGRGLAGSSKSQRPWVCLTCRQYSVSSSQRSTSSAPPTFEVAGKTYTKDDWTNTPSAIVEAVIARLHQQQDHPIAITRKAIESRFPKFKTYNDFSPAVTVGDNFDCLGFPKDHPGRAKSDTYYINEDHVLRTHTSAHQEQIFRKNASDGFLISADVYRRDAVDRSHYPVFHQMEGAMTWDRKAGDLEQQVLASLEHIPKHSITVEDPNPTYHDNNPLQTGHAPAEAQAMATHLKRSLEDVFVTIFSKAAIAAQNTAKSKGLESNVDVESLKMRWVEAYFPFTSPSWELEVFWQGEWLEVLGSGIVKQSILDNAGVPDRAGWAFGLGLERIAMLLFDVPDIRLFWSRDERFLSQFGAGKELRKFEPFSKYPSSSWDVSFWLPQAQDAASITNAEVATKPSATSSASSAGGAEAVSPERASIPSTPLTPTFHENDLMELVRNEAGSTVEDVRLVDEFTHPKTGRSSKCYRIVYRSLERTLTNEEIRVMHDKIIEQLKKQFDVTIRG